MKGDGKDKFYRTLENLEKDDMKLISWFHKTSEKLKKEIDDKNIRNTDD